MNRIKGLVSVCIPTYNCSDYIAETLDSVLNQTYKNIEIIITDNASTDETVKIIKKYSDDRINLFINETKLGMVNNWNEAVSKASGEYIKLLCSDDLLSPDAIEKQVKALDESNAICSIGNSCVINSKGKVIFKRNYFNNNCLKNGVQYAQKSLLGRNIYAEPGNLLYRAAFMDQHGVYDTDLKYTPDWEFDLRLSAYGDIFCLSDIIFYFRISDSSETSKLHKEFEEKILKDTDLMIEKASAYSALNISELRKKIFKLNIRIFSVLRNIVIFFSNK